MRIDIDFKDKEWLNYSVFIDELNEIVLDKKVAIITNPKVSGLHLASLLKKIKSKELYIITIGDGEEYKNLKTIEDILDRAFDHKLDRDSVFIAFGGGVVGDMVGFAASIFQRGIDFIQIPTTLLSQVDASVGGKTGVNNRYGKNLIGAFHQPKAVYCETSFLQTLPKREFGAGVAEIIKMAVMFDKEFFEFLENNSLQEIDNLKEAIKKCVELKAWVVSQDEREKGMRSLLNYGHTFAHVIENITGYKTYLHGEAVAIGMVMANSLALKLGLIEKAEEGRVKRLLEEYDLPTAFKIKDANEFYEHFFLDKKTQDMKIKFILPKGIGANEIRSEIDKELVIEVLQEFCS
jgi:3-dehydroquinate synthase